MAFGKTHLFLGIVLVTFWLSAGLLEARAASECIHARVAEPMMLPDGRVHPAGSLRLCLDSELTPVAGIHTTWLDGQPVGRFVSRVGNPEDPSGSEGAYLRFARATSGTLVLEAYVVPAGDGFRTYALTEPGPRRGHAATRTAAGGTEPVVILAAARLHERAR